MRVWIEIKHELAEVFQRVTTKIGLILALLAIVSIAWGHTSNPPEDIRNSNPVLEVHQNRMITPFEGAESYEIHEHHWCYDIENYPRGGLWFESWFVDELPKEPDMPKTPDPPKVEDAEDAEDTEEEDDSDPTPPVVDSPTLKETDVKQVDVETSEVSHHDDSDRTTSRDDPQERGFQGETPPSETLDKDVKETVAPPPQPPHGNIVLTEIMFLDFAAGPGNPQWFELYNRGTDTNLSGFTLTFLTQSDGTYTKGGQDVVVIGEYLLKTGEAVIVTNKRLQPRPWLLNIDTVIVAPIRNLKNKWVLTDATGKEIYTRNARWNDGWGRHTEDCRRQSIQIVPSAAPDAVYFYGSKWDKGTPGWHEDVAPAAPSLQRPKLVTLWGALKQ